MRSWTKLSGLVAMLVTALVAFSDPAYSDCTGQFSAGQTCGNAGASNAPPSASLLSPLLDRNFGAPSPQGTILNRGATLWSATRAPVLGNPGTNTGTLGFGSASGGTATITPPAIAGNTAVQLPTLAGTIPTTAAPPIVLNPTTGAISCPTCTTGIGGAITVGVTTTSGFSAGQVLRSDGSLVQAYSVTGTGNVVLSASPTFTGTPVLATPTATTVAIGGATIGSDALAVTGTATFSGAVTAAAFIPTANVAPSDGMYLNAVGQTAFAAGATRIFFFNSTGLLMANASGATLTSSAATATAPTVVPRRSDSGSGLGSSGTGGISLIATSIEQLRINNGSIYVGGAATGADTAAVAPTISAALSTGNANNPDLVLQTGVKTSSGSSQATATTGLTIKGETQAVQVRVSLAIGGATIGGNALAITGTSLFNSGVTMGAALTYGGVTLANSVTGTGSMVLSTSPSITTPIFVTSITTPIVNLSASSNQLVFQSAGVTGTLSWTPSSTNKTITLPNGTTDFTATGGASQVLRQSSTGAAITVGTLACTDLSTATTACSTAIGTSGATIPLLNGNNTYSGSANFTSTFQINGNTMTFPAAAATLPRLVASGSSAMNTAAIASTTCNTTTVAATNVVSTDVVGAGFNGATVAVTGYAPLTTGGLSIRPYASAGNVNFEVCNGTTASITPGAITLNWSVLR